MKTFKVHLIKHGKISDKYMGMFIGSTDVPLSQNGRAQLIEYAKKYKYPKSDRIFSSPLKRALQTAYLLYPGQEIELADGLREYDFGNFENLPPVLLNQNPDYVNWIKSGMKTTPKGGEDNSGFIKRITSAFENIVNSMIKDGVGNCSIVTHGAVISALLYIYAVPTFEPYKWNFNNLEGISIMTNTSLFLRSKVFEVIDYLPFKPSLKIE